MMKLNHNRNWSYIHGYPYRIFIIGGSESGKTNVLLNFKKINNQILIKFTFKSKIYSNQKGSVT